METVRAAVRKQTSKNWKAQDWIEHTVEDAMRTAYKTITPLSGADLQTPTSKP